jgi:predicted ATPase
LLGDVARCLFQRLAIFNTPFTFDSMRVVVCDAALTEDDVIDGIGELVAKSLVNVSLDGSEAVYRLFESTRAYAADKLRGTEDVRQIASRHARFVAALIDAHDERDAITVAASADLLAA